MSAFLQSGRSDNAKSGKNRVRFRPGADVAYSENCLPSWALIGSDWPGRFHNDLLKLRMRRRKFPFQYVGSTFRGFFVLAMSIQARPGLPGKTPLTARIDGTANRRICRSTSPRHRDYTSGCVRFIWQPDWYRRRLLRSMFFIPERTKNLATPETNRSCI